MGFYGLFIAIIAGVLALLVSFTLDSIWTGTLGAGNVYYTLRAPGIIVHECSHILGCFVTGAEIKNVVLVSRTGGSVTYSRPPVPFLGDIVINAAPLFIIPLVLYGCTWFFSTYLGCVIPVLTITAVSPGAVLEIAGQITGMFAGNLVFRFNPWFVLYLYLTVSLVLSLAPSSRDMKNAAAGIALIALGCTIVIWSGIPVLISALDQAAAVIGLDLGLGLGSGIVALVVSLPLVAVHAYRR
ncbi:MAG TPA: metalloprotease family protein [Methanoregula sp.]|nr:metalloprotease family protein [Methanoregula sp.]